MEYKEIKSISQEYAEMMAKCYPEIREKTKFRDKMAQAENVIRLLLQKYDVTPKCGLSKKQTVTIDAWIAREKEIVEVYNTDLFIAKQKPERFEIMGSWTNYEEFLPIDMSSFPTITWENSPKKVKITIELEEEQ